MSSIVHLFGNWKWTGPAEPAVQLAAGIGAARFLVGHCPFPDLGNQVLAKARAQGLDARALRSLRKHWHPLRIARAAAEIEASLDRVPELFHVHLDADHAAVRRLSATLRPRPRCVRSVHSNGPYSSRTLRLLREASDLVLTSTFGLARSIEQEAGLPPGSVGVIEPTVDLGRFAPHDSRAARGRRLLGLEEGDVALGVVARIQPHRRFDLLLDTWSLLRERGSQVRLVVFGRGTRQEELLLTPARERGLGDRLLHPGYLDGEDYVDALAACDAGIFLVPGTDVACRAVREWMAMGKGVFASRRPPLGEIITEREEGELLPEDHGVWADRLERPDLPERLDAYGRAARRKALHDFSFDRATSMLRQFYDLVHCARPGALERMHRDPPAPRTLLAVAPPGELQHVRALAEERGTSPDDLTLLHPAPSRDIALDTFAAVHAYRPKVVLLGEHPEWDRPFLDELSVHAEVHRLPNG